LKRGQQQGGRFFLFYFASVNRGQSAAPNFAAGRTYETIFSVVADDDVQFPPILKVNEHFPAPSSI
jgi:hypothetical protein